MIRGGRRTFPFRPRLCCDAAVSVSGRHGWKCRCCAVLRKVTVAEAPVNSGGGDRLHQAVREDEVALAFQLLVERSVSTNASSIASLKGKSPELLRLPPARPWTACRAMSLTLTDVR